MKLNLVYYKCLLDIVVEDFVHKHEDLFTKCNGRYVLGLSTSKAKLQAELDKCINDVVNEVRDAYCRKDDVLVVIGSCWPRDNLLLEFKDYGYFPAKLQKLIDTKPALKWILSERDIDISIDLLNELLVSLFNKRFCAKATKRSAELRPAVMYLSHSHLDCYMLFKTLKWAYGSSNCCNVWKEKLASRKPCLVAVNDLISKYIHNKSRMNKSTKFKQYAHEVKDYVDEKLRLKEQ